MTYVEVMDKYKKELKKHNVTLNKLIKLQLDHSTLQDKYIAFLQEKIAIIKVEE